MSVLFLTTKKGNTHRQHGSWSGKAKKIFLAFFLLVFISVNFFGLNINTVYAADAWWNVSWNHRVRITINASQVPSTQTNFPMYVNLADLPAGFWSNVKSDGSDIRVTNSLGTELAREIESISIASSTGALWFKADSISDASYYYIYYGSSEASEPSPSSTYGKNNVWDTNFKGVWHLPNGTALSAYDSTSNGKNGTTIANVIATPGKIGGAGDFSGTGSYIKTDSTAFGASQETVSMIIKVDSTSQERVLFMNKESYGAVNGAEIWMTGARLYARGGGNTSAISNVNFFVDTNSYYFLNIVYSGTSATFYRNGVAFGSGTVEATASNTYPIYIGKYSTLGGYEFDGTIDEVRISESARSADWIRTEYNNQSAPASFYQVASEEAVTVPGIPTGLTPTAGNTQVSLAWTAPVNTGGIVLTDYVIDYKLNSTSTWSTYADGVSTTTTFTIIGLINGTSYDFRVSAVNAVGQGNASATVMATPATIPSAPAKGTATKGNASASVAFTLLPNPSVAPWYDNDWTYRKKITIDKTKVPNTNQTNFPVLVSLTGLSNINADGTDIRFTDSTGTTELAREIESYSAGTLVAWVKVPTLSTSENTDIYMYYGNSSQTSEPSPSSTYGSQNVWDTGYKTIQHLKDNTTSTVIDSTTNNTGGTKRGVNEPLVTTGRIGGGQEFDGDNDRIDLVNTSSVLNINTYITMEAWVYPKESGADRIIIATPPSPYPYFFALNNLAPEAYLGGTSPAGWKVSTSTVTQNAWSHVVAVYTGSNILFYINGSCVSTVSGISGSMGNVPGAIQIGDRTDMDTYEWYGTLDEVRISSTARSADWIKTEYNNQSSPATFYAVATEENVVNSATNGGSVITAYTVTSSPGGIQSASTTSPIIVTGLTNGVPYTFTITATNVMGTGPASVASDPVTPATVPGAPIAILTTPGNSQVSLSWTAPVYDGDSSITDYVIEYKLTSGSVWSQIGHDPSPVTTIIATGLSNGTSYDFRISAKNDMGVGSPSTPLVSSTPRTIPSTPTITSAVSGDTQVTVNFTPLSDPTWYNNSWTYRKKITIDKTKVPNTNQTNFPVLISLTGLSNINANGTDIRFTDSTGTTELAREIESYSAGTLVAWVKVPTLSTSENTDIYMYYGNSEAAEPAVDSTYGKNNVWDANFKGVWHLPNGMTLIANDSTSNANNGTLSAIPPTATTGQVDGAGIFNGSSSNINLGNSSSLNFGSGVGFSASAWIKTSVNNGMIFSMRNSSNGSPVIDMGVGYNAAVTNNGHFIPLVRYDSGSGLAYFSSTQAVNDNNWHLVSIVYSPIDQKIYAYIDNSSWNLPQTVTGSITTLNNRAIGTEVTWGTNYFNGSIDEIRISSTARSADWIATEYNNQSDPASFYQVAGEENISNSASNGGSEITAYNVTSNPGGLTATGLSSPIIVTGLTNGTAYTFTMTASNVVGTGPTSVASDPVTPAGVPGVPTLLIATPGNTQVNLAWTAPVDNGAEITNYVIEYKLHSAPSWTQLGHAVSPETTITVIDLLNGSEYDFRVSAYNSAGTGAPSDPPVSSIPRTVSGQPAITGVLRGNGQVTVDFTPPASDGGSVITGYTVTSDPQGIIQSGTASPIIISGLTNGTAYTFTVTATNVAGTSEASVPSNSVTPATVPGKAIDVVAVAGNGQATITFSAPLSTGGSAITGYVVTSNNGGTDSSAGSTELSHIVTGLTNGQTYTFTVVATNDVGPGQVSDVSNSITLPTVPTVPLNLAAVVKSSSIDLTWSAPATDGGSVITDYVIEYQLTIGGSWVPFADGVSPDRLVTVTGLSNSTSYDFRVSAKNIIGQGEASNSVSATPGEPAQVFIQGFPDLTNTSIGTNVRITNEGLLEYEYQYTWCVTDAVDNLCGGGDDVFSASNAKLIDVDDNYDFTATSTVSTPGDYYFHVKVLYGSQSSSAFQSFTAVATFPDPPTAVSAVAGNAVATVSFTAPASNGGSAITGYTVTSNPGGLTGTGLTTPIMVTGLTNGTAYTFTMTATNIIGTGLSSSPPSNSVTPMTVPGAITSFSASPGNTEVGLFWSAPASNGGSAIIDYVIEYKLSSDSSWSVFAEAISTATTITVTGLINNQSYDFRVSAVNIVGQGPVNVTSVASGASRASTGSSGSRTPYSPRTMPPSVPTTTPNVEIITPITPSNVPKIKVPPESSPQGSNIEPIKNEVSTTPTETSKITPPVKQKQVPTDNSQNTPGLNVPWWGIIISFVSISFIGFIIFILRRRRLDD